MNEPSADAGAVVVTTSDGVATLWLNRPEKRNAVTFEMWQEIAEQCDRLAADRSVRLLVVRGAGDHFCAGADIGSLGATSEYAAANEAADNAIATFPTPTVAFIRGSCIGGGAEIAIACDLRIADDTSRFGITPARLGIVYPAFAVERAVRVIGPSAAKHLLFTAELIDAARALRIGLVDELHEAGDAERRLDELTRLLATERSLLTQMASKEMVDAVVDAGGISPEIARRWGREVAAGPDRAEGIAAFAERRTPRFTWGRPGTA